MWSTNAATFSCIRTERGSSVSISASRPVGKTSFRASPHRWDRPSRGMRRRRATSWAPHRNGDVLGAIGRRSADRRCSRRSPMRPGGGRPPRRNVRALQSACLPHLGALVLALAVGRSLTAAAGQQMTAAVEGFSRGVPMPMPTQSHGEIGLFARAFARMLEEVRAQDRGARKGSRKRTARPRQNSIRHAATRKAIRRRGAVLRRCDRHQDAGRRHYRLESGRRTALRLYTPMKRSARASISSSLTIAGTNCKAYWRGSAAARSSSIMQTVRRTKDGKRDRSLTQHLADKIALRRHYRRLQDRPRRDRAEARRGKIQAGGRSLAERHAHGRPRRPHGDGQFRDREFFGYRRDELIGQSVEISFRNIFAPSILRSGANMPPSPTTRHMADEARSCAAGARTARSFRSRSGSTRSRPGEAFSSSA